jgi:hypothetical protein
MNCASRLEYYNIIEYTSGIDMLYDGELNTGLKSLILLRTTVMGTVLASLVLPLSIAVSRISIIGVVSLSKALGEATVISPNKNISSCTCDQHKSSQTFILWYLLHCSR